MEIDHILELYKHLAPIYEEVYGEEQRAKYWRVASQVGSRVIDAGCGVGVAFDVLEGYVVCLDISLDMLRRAVQRRGDRGELVLADYRLPPFRRGAFDSALFLSSVEPASYDEVASLWLGIAERVYLEFRGQWRIVEQRN
ncbi:MAG: class I SAM-dependent methyltransferase [Pyrobaculum sp.]